MISVFTTTMQKSYEWVREIGESLSLDDTAAYIALRATLHGLRDRLTVTEAAQFGAQLPMLLRGMYYDSWRPGKIAVGTDDLQSFFGQVRARAGNLAVMDDTERLVRGVLRVIAARVPRAELDDLMSLLPSHLAGLISVESGKSVERERSIPTSMRTDRPIERVVEREMPGSQNREGVDAPSRRGWWKRLSTEVDDRR